jgi:hypothetical protein
MKVKQMYTIPQGHVFYEAETRCFVSLPLIFERFVDLPRENGSSGSI